MLAIDLLVMRFLVAFSLAARGITLQRTTSSSFGSCKTVWGNEEITKMMKKGASERIVPQRTKTRSNYDQKLRINRFLITVNIQGSAGPIRFVVNEKDLVSGVIETALKSYAREGRLPVLGSDASNFLLHCANGFEAMNPLDAIGSCGARTFVLSKKQGYPPKTEGHPMMTSQKGSSSWKEWLNKPFHFKFTFHGHRDMIIM